MLYWREVELIRGVSGWVGGGGGGGVGFGSGFLGFFCIDR